MVAVQQFIFLHPLAKTEVEKITKTPEDQVQLEALFKSVISNAPYTLTWSNVAVFDNDGNDVTASMVGTITQDYSNGGVAAVIKGGVDGGKYIIFFDAISSENPNMRGAVKLRVKELKA